jgi:predicted tellurium resistance membrane protein TerC
VLELLTDPQAWIAFITLSGLEIVLGIDNIIFISILVGRLPPAQRDSARISGLAFAMVTRVALLFSIVWLTRLTQPWFDIAGQGVSGRDLILFLGGLFLLVKSVLEIHQTLEGASEQRTARVYSGFVMTVAQIGIIDIVFSLDSVFTAVGLANQLPVMVAAIIVAILVMMVVSGAISAFVDRHPTIKILALSFLILIGFALISEGAHYEIPKGYLYFAMAFSVTVEMINIRLRRLLDRRRSQSEDVGGRLTDRSRGPIDPPL